MKGLTDKTLIGIGQDYTNYWYKLTHEEQDQTKPILEVYRLIAQAQLEQDMKDCDSCKKQIAQEIFEKLDDLPLLLQTETIPSHLPIEIGFKYSQEYQSIKKEYRL